MLNVRWSKILHDIWLYKTRTVLIIAAVAVGVTAVGVTVTSETVLRRDLSEEYVSSVPADAVLTVAPFGDRLVKTVSRLPEVQAVEARRVAVADLEISPDRWADLELHAISDFDALSLCRLNLEAGATSPPPEGSILLDRSVLNMPGVEIGDHVRVHTPDGAFHELKVAGFVNDLAPLPSDMSLWAVGYLAPDTLATLFPDQPRTYNRLYVRVAREEGEAWPTRTGVERAVTRISSAIESLGYPVLLTSVPEPGRPILEDNVDTILIILNTLGVLSLMLSAFLIVNVMSGLIAQQIPQIGIIKSLGGRTRQITRLYLQMVLLFGLMAVCISLPLGAAGAYFLTNMSATMMDFDVVSFGLPARTLLLQTLSALLVPVLAALFPILSGARITVRQAIDRTGLAEGNTLVSRLLAHVHGLPPLLNLALRNVFRKWARMALTLAALALGGAIFIAVLGIRQSLLDAIREMQRVQDYDVEIHLAQTYPIAHIEREALRVPGVDVVESWYVTDARCVFGDGHVSRSFTLMGVPVETDMTHPLMLAGHWLSPAERHTILVDSDMADLIGSVRVGDEVTLRIGDDERPWRVVGITGRMFTPHVFMNRADLERLMGRTGYANWVVVSTTRHTPEFQALVEQRLMDHLELVDMPVAYSWISGPGHRALAAQLDAVIAILLAMVILVAIVGGLGLASTMGLNVLERTREIGILRSLGARSGVVRRMVIVEGVATSLVSFLLAIPLSVPISLALGRAVGQELLMHPLAYTFSGVATLLWLVIVLIIAVMASLLPANSAASLTIRETLAYVG